MRTRSFRASGRGRTRGEQRRKKDHHCWGLLAFRSVCWSASHTPSIVSTFYIHCYCVISQSLYSVVMFIRLWNRITDEPMLNRWWRRRKVNVLCHWWTLNSDSCCQYEIYWSRYIKKFKVTLKDNNFISKTIKKHVTIGWLTDDILSFVLLGILDPLIWKLRSKSFC